MINLNTSLPVFNLIGVKPGFNYPEENGQSAFFDFSEKSFQGKWKVIYYYPKDFTFVCPTEITEFAALQSKFAEKNAILIGGSTDNEFCKLAWRREHPKLDKLNHYSFADPTGKLANDLGVLSNAGVALRATFIVDPESLISAYIINKFQIRFQYIDRIRTEWHISIL